MPTSGYDAASRLNGVTNGINSARYDYLANSSLISQIKDYQNSDTVVTITKQFDNLNRLKAVQSSNGVAGLFSSSAYAYNNANQRTGVTNQDSSFWNYSYDSLGQVNSAKKHWSDGAYAAGQQFEYGFDHIGNRKFAASGGNEWGSNLRYANYTVNSLNQYTQRAVPGVVDVIGAATNSVTVTVNNNPSYRKGEYFWNEYRTNNSASAKYLWLTNLAVLNDGTNADIIATNIGRLFLPKNPESYAYDADGNLTSDGQWAPLYWDAQGRLTVMFSAPSGMINMWLGYDGQGRRISKTVAVWTNSQWVTNLVTRYLYDGWNMIAELDGTNGLVRTYCWGLDGLAFETDQKTISNQVSTHFALTDGNGNVVTLANASDATVSAVYEYDPFGKVLRGDGQMATANPIRFAAKFQDNESDFVSDGSLSYNPSTGRSLNRSSKNEEGGINPYWYARNNLLGKGGPGSGIIIGYPRPPTRPNPPRTGPPASGTCRIEVCCKPAGGLPHAHCVIRFTSSGGDISGCRGGPTGNGNSSGAGGSSGSSGSGSGNRQSSHCKGCCGSWGNIIAGCGKGRDTDDPLERGLWNDLNEAQQHPSQCSLVAENAAACSVQSCVSREMQNITSRCYIYNFLGHNSNTTWYQALKNCGYDYDPPGRQPGSTSFSNAKTCLN